MMRGTARAIGGTGWPVTARRVVVALLVAAGGAAQAADDVTAVPSAAERCLAPSDAARARPVYPADMFEIKRSGEVEVRLTFTAPDRGPEVEVARSSDRSFEDAVRVYAAGLRVPCMAAGGVPMTVRQEFNFVPNDGRKVAFTAPVDVAAAAAKPRYACLAKPALDRPLYPDKLVRQGVEGTVVFRLHFTDPA